MRNGFNIMLIIPGNKMNGIKIEVPALPPVGAEIVIGPDGDRFTVCAITFGVEREERHTYGTYFEAEDIWVTVEETK